MLPRVAYRDRGAGPLKSSCQRITSLPVGSGAFSSTLFPVSVAEAPEHARARNERTAALRGALLNQPNISFLRPSIDAITRPATVRGRQRALASRTDTGCANYQRTSGGQSPHWVSLWRI